SVDRSPIDERETRHADGAVVALLRRTLVTAMATAADLETDGKDALWEREHFKTEQVDGRKLLIHREVIIFLRQIAGGMYVVLKPSFQVRDSQGQELPRKTINTIKLALLGYQHNKEFNQEMQRWRGRLFKGPQCTFEYPLNCASPFRFKIRRSPIFAAL